MIRLRKDRVLRVGTDGRFYLGPAGRFVVDDVEGLQIGAETLARAVRAYKSGSDMKLADLSCDWDRRLIDILCRDQVRPYWATDCLSEIFSSPWVGTPILSGQCHAGSSNTEHIGIVAPWSSINQWSGYWIGSGPINTIRPAGGEVATAIFLYTGEPATQAQFGFFTSLGAGDLGLYSGVYFYISDNIIHGRVRRNFPMPINIDTPLSALTVNHWYKAILRIDIQDPTYLKARFELWNSPGSQIEDWEILSQIPVFYDNCNWGWESKSTDTTGGKVMHQLDLLEYRIDRLMSR